MTKADGDLRRRLAKWLYERYARSGQLGREPPVWTDMDVAVHRAWKVDADALIASGIITVSGARDAGLDAETYLCPNMICGRVLLSRSDEPCPRSDCHRRTWQVAAPHDTGKGKKQ